jgi:hypothetical protein
LKSLLDKGNDSRIDLLALKQHTNIISDSCVVVIGVWVSTIHRITKRGFNFFGAAFIQTPRFKLRDRFAVNICKAFAVQHRSTFRRVVVGKRVSIIIPSTNEFNIYTQKIELDKKIRASVANLQQASNLCLSQRAKLASSANQAVGARKQAELNELAATGPLYKASKIISLCCAVLAAVGLMTGRDAISRAIRGCPNERSGTVYRYFEQCGPVRHPTMAADSGDATSRGKRSKMANGVAGCEARRNDNPAYSAAPAYIAAKSRNVS